MKELIIEFCDKQYKDKIIFTDFEIKFKQAPIFIYSTLIIDISGFKKDEQVKIELIDLKLFFEKLSKLNSNELKLNQVIFTNIDETFKIEIKRIDNKIDISGYLVNFLHTIKFEFKFESDLSCVQNLLMQIKSVIEKSQV